jgi:hypothetical protein
MNVFTTIFFVFIFGIIILSAYSHSLSTDSYIKITKIITNILKYSAILTIIVVVAIFILYYFWNIKLY